MSVSKYNYLFKIVIVGDHNCGKSCVLLRFAESRFRDDHVTTLGVDFKLKTIKLDRDRIRLELWDTAGLERYRTIYNSYYHSAHGVVIVYDITDRRSFENLKNYWLQEVRAHAPQNAVLMLIGNKCDLGESDDAGSSLPSSDVTSPSTSSKRRVEFAEAERLASELNVSLFEVSAKTGINVDEAFSELSRDMRERLLLWRAGGHDVVAPATTPNGILSDHDTDFDADDFEAQLAGGFHVDGVFGEKKSSFQTCNLSSCCYGGKKSSGATFV